MRPLDHSAKSSHVVTWLAMLTLFASTLGAQSPAASVARCRALLDSVQRAGQPGPPDFGALMHVVRPCVEHIDVDAVPPEEAVTLAHLLRNVGDDRRAGTVIDRRLADLRLTPTERRQALGVALEIYGNTDTTLARSSQIVRELDTLESSQLDQRILAHETLLRAASVVNKPDVEHREAVTLLDLAGRSAGQDTLARLRVFAIALATEALADQLAAARHGEHVGMLVDSVQHRFADLRELPDRLARIRASYALIGRPAPGLRADRWIGDSVAMSDARGRVRVLEFTAHWCAPCHQSYPALVATQRRHGASEVAVVLATQTYGYFGDETLAVPEEIRRDSVMYARELPIPAAIAIERRPDGADDQWRGANAIAYGVKPLPVIVVIDRKGVVRDLWYGWSTDSAARIERDVASLSSASAQ
jgi:hypothetical protein